MRKSRQIFSLLHRNIPELKTGQSGGAHCKEYFLKDDLPMVDAVMDARRPRIQENGSDIAMAPVPIFSTYKWNLPVTLLRIQSLRNSGVPQLDVSGYR